MVSPDYFILTNGTEFKSELIEYLSQQLGIKRSIFPLVWFPIEHSQESLHFLYFRCEPYFPHLAAFLQPKLKYLGSDEGIIHLDKLRQGYMLAALNTKEAQSKQSGEKYDNIPQYKLMI